MGAFSFGLGSLAGGGTSTFEVPGSSPIPIFGGPQPVPTTAPPSSSGGTLATIVNGGLGVMNSILGYNLLNNQINHNQYPSITYDAAGRPAGVPSVGLSGFGSNIWLLLIGVFVLIMLLRK